MKFKIERVFFPMFLCFALVLLTHVPLHALIFTWGGAPISGEAGEEYPYFFPEGSAEFNIIDTNTLQLILTYTGSSESLCSINQVLTALTWDLEGFTGTLDAVSAVIATGSDLVLDPIGTFAGNNLSGQWAYKDDINTVDLGAYGVGTIGDINFGEDTFGSDNIINSTFTQLEYTPVPNGIDFGLIPIMENLPSSGGFQNQGPVVANSMIFEFVYDYDGKKITPEMFTNVTPLFGSDGAAPVPEPSTVLLVGTGLLGMIAFGRKRLNKKA